MQGITKETNQYPTKRIRLPNTYHDIKEKEYGICTIMVRIGMPTKELGIQTERLANEST